MFRKPENFFLLSILVNILCPFAIYVRRCHTAVLLRAAFNGLRVKWHWCHEKRRNVGERRNHFYFDSCETFENLTAPGTTYRNTGFYVKALERKM